MKYEMTVDDHAAVGPVPDTHGHGPVTAIDFPTEDGGEGASLRVCLDCGFVHPDIRMFAHADCDRAHNPINTTWRERLEESPLPAALDERAGNIEE